MVLLGLLSEPESAHYLSPKYEEQFTCLAKNIYFEARNQPETGQLAVGHVTLNRLESDAFPDNICDVVYENRYRWRLNKCQFSWYCDGKSDRPREPEAWAQAQEIAKDAIILYSAGYDVTYGATHYHSIKVLPDWAPEFTALAQIGDHIFYK